MHALAGSTGREGACGSQHHTQDIVELHLRTAGGGAWEGNRELEITSGIEGEASSAADVVGNREGRSRSGKD